MLRARAQPLWIPALAKLGVRARLGRRDNLHLWLARHQDRLAPAIGCLVMQQLVADSAVTVYDITEVSVRQSLVRDRSLGRVASTFNVTAMLAQLTATLAAGILAEVIGLRATSWLAPIGGLIAAVILWTSPVRTLLVLPERPPENGGDRPGPLAEAAAAAVLADRDQPVGG